MKDRLKILRKGLLMFFSISCLYGCATSEERAKESEATAVTKVHTVVIQQMKFTPADLTVNEGDTVTWVNKDIVDHNVTEEKNKEWASSNLPAERRGIWL